MDTNNNIQKAKNVPPFVRYCSAIIPTMFDDSLSYYEALCALWKWMQDNLVDVINNNATVTEEYIRLTNELKEYVENYFENLDVQEEINNKLDEMVESGQMSDLIAQYIGLGALVTFDTLADMVASVNLSAGTRCQTLGKYTINDGFGAYYKIDTTGDIELANGLYATLVPDFGGNNYYDEVTYSKSRDNDTDYYVVTVPKEDSDNNQIKLYLSHHEGVSPNAYARNTYTTLTINAPLYISPSVQYGSMIIDGEIVADVDTSGINEAYVYIGIKEDGSIVDYQANITTANQMLTDGCQQAFMGYNRLIRLGEIVDFSQIHIAEDQHIIDGKHPRQAIGQKSDGTVIIFTCDGRTGNDAGMTCQEMAEIMLDLGCYNAWNLDGGGSASTSVKGDKINRNIDSNGTVDRPIPYTLNVKKETIDTELAKAFSHDGLVKQEIYGTIMPYIKELGSATKIGNTDVDTLASKLIFGMGANLTNAPTTSGYLINIPHVSTEWIGKYAKQLFFSRDNKNTYVRTLINEVWTSWTLLGTNYLKINADSLTTTSNGWEYVNFDSANMTSNISNLYSLENPVNNKSTGIQTNINGLLRMKVFANLTCSSDGEKTIEFVANQTSLAFSQSKISGKAGETYVISTEYSIASITPQNVYRIAYKGSSGDTLSNIRVFFEC